MSKWAYIVEDDDATCEMCLDFLDLVVDELIVAPPFHINCRCDIEEIDEDAPFNKELKQSSKKDRKNALWWKDKIEDNQGDDPKLVKAAHKALNNNAFNSGKIFGDDHAYFDEGETDIDFE